MGIESRGAAPVPEKGARRPDHPGACAWWPDPMGICAGRENEVVFETSAGAVVNQIDSGPRLGHRDLLEVGNPGEPLSGIVADQVIAPRGERLEAGHRGLV